MCCARNCGLTGTKEGCGEGECGACSVDIDGELVNSCLVPVLQADGAKIRTIEGVADAGRCSAVQQAFLERGGAQCGICTPGMILAAMNLARNAIPQPTEEEIREGLAGNLCRCTGYTKIFESVFEPAANLRSAAHEVLSCPQYRNGSAARSCRRLLNAWRASPAYGNLSPAAPI